MLINQARIASGPNSTLSTISVVDSFGIEEAFGFIIEDKIRRFKIPGRTAIPAGTYKITFRKEGGLHEKYKKRYGSSHYGMLWIRNIPNFEWVYYHPGNKHEDTDGCPLVGKYAYITPSGDFEIPPGFSNDAYLSFYTVIAKCLLDDEEVKVKITESPNVALI